MELGRSMYNKEITDVAALLAKPNDSEEVKQIKKLITDMLAPDATARPKIGEVVDRLSQLCTTLGVQFLVGVNTIWKTSVYYSKSTTFHDLKVFLQMLLCHFFSKQYITYGIQVLKPPTYLSTYFWLIGYQ